MSALLPVPDLLRPGPGVDSLLEVFPALPGRDFIGRPLLSISLLACFLMSVIKRTINRTSFAINYKSLETADLNRKQITCK